MRQLAFQYNDVTKTIQGYDYTDPNNNYAFTWQGIGMLSMLKSKWEVIILNEELECGVIWFSKILFTPEGVDIITRHNQLNIELLGDIRVEMEQYDILKPFIKELRNVSKI